MSHAVNGTIVRIVGMARSGNHAIIGWMLRQLPGRWCFLNCVEPSTSPFRTARPIGDGDAAHLSTVPGFDLAAERAGRLSRKDLLVFSHEDTFLKIAFGERATALQEAAVGSAARRIDVLILRDPYNLFASRRRLSCQLVSDEIAVRIWKQHARAFLGDSRYLGPDAVRIGYNDWVRDRGYRRGLAERLGLDFTDSGIERVARCAGGSSFDGTRYEGRATEMAVFDRWRRYADDPTFRALFDPELADFAERIFGPLPGAVMVGTSRRPAAMHHPVAGEAERSASAHHP